MSLLSLLLAHKQPEGGVLGYAKRHVAGGNPLDQVNAQVDAGIDKGRDQIIAGIHAVIGEHAGSWDDIAKALADQLVVTLAATVKAAADKAIPGGA